ncbi:uncharacterized protein TNCV_3238631 [Trichonephila clavipes]|nr:uncharacterized protein TNCV_3238631 [Trichonephila clavipes]
MFGSSSYVNPTPLAHADTSRDVLPRGGTSQVLRKIRVRGTQVRPISADHLSDHHLALGQNQIKKVKIGRMETLAYKRSFKSGSGGPERKIRKGLGHRVDKRTLSLNISNDLPQFRKKVRTEERVMSSTSGYNLRRSRGPKVDFRPPMRRGPNKGDQFEPEEAENISTAPRSKSKQGQAAGIPEAEVVNNSIARRGKEERENSNRSISLEVLVEDGNYKS